MDTNFNNSLDDVDSIGEQNKSPSNWQIREQDQFLIHPKIYINSRGVNSKLRKKKRINSDLKGDGLREVYDQAAVSTKNRVTVKTSQDVGV